MGSYITLFEVVAVGGLEPPRPKATDFESVVYTNFTTPPLLVACFTLVSEVNYTYSNAGRKQIITLDEPTAHKLLTKWVFNHNPYKNDQAPPLLLECANLTFQ